jgi:hypothetical protein
MATDNAKRLNELSCYIDKTCIRCGRKYPETVINIEGHLHHGTPYECVDTKSCNKIKNKKK